MEITFSKHRKEKDADNVSSECRSHLQSIVSEVVRVAVASGWDRQDVLLGLVDVAWDLYETGRDDR